MKKALSKITVTESSAQRHSNETEKTSSSNSSETEDNKRLCQSLNCSLKQEEIALYNLPKYYD
ncbi:MAG: hypothetical protein QXV37_03520, partial [Candidatus Jordarchaeaceae archaeon]